MLLPTRPDPRGLATALAALWRPLLIATLAALIWVAHFDRWTAASWRVPTDYTGDAHETLARLKAASEGGMIPLERQVIPRLGAPFGAHWNAYPTPDKPLMVALGSMVRWLGLAATANLGLVLAQISAALAFYFVARWLRCRWEWAAAGALLFAYTYHTFHRGLAHFSLVFTWTVPLGLLAVWLVARSRRMTWGNRDSVVCLAAAAALGTSNPYNLFFWLQLMGWALVAQWMGGRRRANLQIGLAAVAVAVVAFFIVNGEVWLHVDDPQGQPLLTRNYDGTERYALKPVEMFIPPPFHHVSWLAFLGQRYSHWSEWRGEVFLPYLGLVGIAGFAWLGLITLRRVLQRRALPGPAVAVAWLIGYAMIGGVTNVLAFYLGFQMFRATNRAAVFISAIVLLFLMVRLSRVAVRWPRWAGVAASAVLAAVGIFDQLPRPDSPDDVRAIASAVKADEQFGAALEDALPDGAMVFQLPILGFPEVVPPNHLDSYEHFRPYLATHDLRFSYGAAKTRARSRWQREIEALPIGDAVHRLEEAGFAALYINRKGYADRGEGMLRDLARLGYNRRLTGPSGAQVVVFLHPATDPRPPVAHAFTLGRGWQNAVEGGTRWGYDDAALSYFNPYPGTISVDVRLTLVAADGAEVEIEHEGKPLRQFPIGAKPMPCLMPGVALVPGVNHFTVHLKTAAVGHTAGPNQMRPFGVRGTAVSFAASGAMASSTLAATTSIQE